jgi:cupin 2 domain-containing protein
MMSHEELAAGNLLAHLPTRLADEALEVLAETSNVRIERIVSLGHASPEGVWYDQPQTEFVVLITGEAHVEFEGESQPRELKPGDYLAIPAHCRHRVAWTTSDEPSVWLAVHFGAE